MFSRIKSALAYLRTLFSFDQADLSMIVRLGPMAPLDPSDRPLYLDVYGSPSALCLCGQPYIPTTFNAWNPKLEADTTLFMLSCTTPNCTGNVAQWHRERVEAMHKLDHHDREVLGLTWTEPRPRAMSVFEKGSK